MKLTRTSNFMLKLSILMAFAGFLLVENLSATVAPETLSEALDNKKADFTAMAPAEVSATYEQGIRDVAADKVMQTAKGVGDTAPDFTLLDATGQAVTLSELLAEGPVVLTWYRGGWCPYCNIQLRYLQQKLPEFEAAGASLVAISPELPDKSLSTKEKGELDFYVLSDQGNDVAADYGIKYTLPPEIIEAFRGRLDVPGYNGDDSWTLPLSVTYVVDTDGTITYAFVDPDYRVRAEPAVLVQQVQKLK